MPIFSSLFAAVETGFAPVREFVDMLFKELAERRLELLIFAIGMLVTLLVVAITKYLIQIIVRHLTSRTRTDLDDRLILQLNAPLQWLIFATGTMLSVGALRLPETIAHYLPRCYYAVMTLLLVWGLMRFIGVLDGYFKNIARANNSSLDDLLIDLLRRIAKAAIWIFAVIFIAQNIFKLNVSALLAGAGVVGLAVAFAAQNTIANIFGAITLILDKPFKVGDRIEVAGSNGMVEAIGLRSTRLRSLDGTVWYVPNREMADSKLLNFAQRPNFKYAFEIGLVYSTTPAQMRRATEILNEILNGHELMDMQEQPPRIYFTDFKDFSLAISVIVWFQTQDYFEMQQARHLINLQILERFNAEGLSFAFPTTTNYLVGPDGGAVQVVNKETINRQTV